MNAHLASHPSSPSAILPSNDPEKKHWKVALASLSSELQSQITLVARDHIGTLEAVLQQAQLKRTECLSKRWRFKNSKGEVIILRDVMEKIVRWIDRFKATGDIAVGFDQTGASLPWAAVRFLLVCASSDVTAFGARLETIEFVTHLIAKYREFERLYLGNTSTIEDQLEAALVRLYAVILEALGNTIQALGKSTVHRLIKSPLWLADDHVPRMKEKEDELLKLAMMSDSEVIRSLQTMSLRLIGNAKSYDESLEHDQYRKILTWLSPTNSSAHHVSVSAHRIADTANWLLDHPQFQSWSNSSASGILLIRGLAGSGKTMLSSRVVDELLSQRRDHQSAAPFAFFYCSANPQEPDRAHPDNIIRNLLRQLAISLEPAPVVRQNILSEYKEYKRRTILAPNGHTHQDHIERLEIEDCRRLIMDITDSDPVTLVVDAIDEISEDQRFRLLQFLNQVTEESANVVKILLTSRDDHQISSLLSRAQMIRISTNDNSADVRSFVASQVESATRERRLLNGTISPALKEELEDFLFTGAGEMFLWAKLQLEYIIRMKHKQDVARTIREQNYTTLHGLYAEIVKKVLDAGPAARALAIRGFTWLIFARENMNPTSYLTALNQGSEDEPLTLDDIENVCYNLIVHDAGQVRFVHQSAQDYISQCDEFAKATGNQELAETCLRSCLDGEFDSLTSGVDEFKRYCYVYWVEHYALCKGSQNSGGLQSLLDEFVFETRGSNEPAFSFIVWHDSIRRTVNSLPWSHPSIQDLNAIPNSVASPFFMACIFGILPLVQRLFSISTDFDCDCLNDSGHTGLYLASHKGYLQVVKFLIHRGSNARINCGAQGNALNAACAAGHKHIVDFLLCHEDIYWDSQACARALEIAFEHHREDIAMSIVSHEISNYEKEEYNTAISRASQAGFISVVAILHQSGSPKSWVDQSEGNYSRVIQSGRLSMLRFMLQKFSHTSADLPEEGIALAAQHGQTDTVVFLLDLGLNIEQEGQFGTPLRVASIMDHSSTIIKLVERGAKVDAETYYGTALNAAVLKGNVHAVRILLDNGARIRQADFKDAVLNQHFEITKILVAVGSDLKPITLRPAQWRQWSMITPFLESKGLIAIEERERQSGSSRGSYN